MRGGHGQQFWILMVKIKEFLSWGDMSSKSLPSLRACVVLQKQFLIWRISQNDCVFTWLSDNDKIMRIDDRRELDITEEGTAKLKKINYFKKHNIV